MQEFARASTNVSEIITCIHDIIGAMLNTPRPAIKLQLVKIAIVRSFGGTICSDAIEQFDIDEFGFDDVVYADTALTEIKEYTGEN